MENLRADTYSDYFSRRHLGPFTPKMTIPSQVQMTDEEPLRIPKIISLLWGRLMMAKQYEAATLVGLLAHFLHAETKDPELKGGLSLAISAIDEIKEREAGGTTSGEEVCSFCGGKRPEVRLVGGAKGFICKACAETSLEALRRG